MAQYRFADLDLAAKWYDEAYVARILDNVSIDIFSATIW